jgi:hypothetical protein
VTTADPKKSRSVPHWGTCGIPQASNLSAMADGEPPAFGVGDRVALLGTIVDRKADFAMVNVDGVTPPSTFICVGYASLVQVQVQEPGIPEPGS